MRPALSVLVGLVVASAMTRARSAPSKTGEDQFRLGAENEAKFSFAPALEHYRACRDLAPGSRWARSARDRIAWIEERSEGDFAALSVLARVRSRPSDLDDAKVRDQLAAETESLGSGLVRSELRLRIAEALLRQADRAAAIRELRRIVADPSAGSADAAVAAHELADIDRLLRRRLLRRTVGASSVALLVLVAALAVVRKEQKI